MTLFRIQLTKFLKMGYTMYMKNIHGGIPFYD